MNILRPAFLVAFFTIISRITGFVRDIIIAKIVGTGIYADVFFAAFKLTNLLRKVLIEGSFFAAFVPSFTSIKEKYGLLEARNFASRMFSIAFYLVAVITIFANIFMDEITEAMAPGFKGEKLQMTISLSYIIFWYFVAIALISIISGVLNGIRKFSYYAIVPIFMNLSIIFFTIFLRDKFQDISYCLAWGVVFGGIVQFIFIYGACVYEKFIIRLQLPTKDLITPDTKASYKKMLPSIIGGGLTQVNTMVDLILGSYIVSGVSYLYYTDRIFFLPTSVIGTAISIVILPFIAKQIAIGRIDKANIYIKEAIELSTILVFPASFLILFNAELITSIIFERGAFTSKDVYFVSSMLKILAISLPFCVFTKILSAIFFGYSNTKTPMFITFFSVAVNVITSISLMPILGVFAIAIGTTLSYILSFLLSTLLLLKNKMLHINTELFPFFCKIFITSAISFVLLQWVAMHPQFGYHVMIYNLGILSKLTYIFFLLLITGLVYFLLSLVAGVNVYKMLFVRHEKNA